MNTQKTMMILLLGSVMIGLGLCASAEEIIVSGEELLIVPNPDTQEPWVIAPSLTDESDLDIDIPEKQDNSKLVDAAGVYVTTSKETDSTNLDIGIQALIIAGTVFVLLMALLFLNRKK